MTENIPENSSPTVNPAGRYVIRAKTPAYYEAVKKLYNSGISKAQIHRIMDITKGSGDLVAMRVVRPVGEPNIWFVYHGRRYDVKPDGNIAREVRTGPPRPAAKAARDIKCQLCGKTVPVAHYELSARCPACGFQLVRCNVVRRT